MAFRLNARTKFYLCRYDTNRAAALTSFGLVFAEVDTKNCCECAYAQILPLDKKYCRLRLKCGGKRAETRFRLSAKRTSPFKSAGTSVQSTAGSRGVRISGSNAGTPWSEVVWRVLATHSIHQFPLHFPFRASQCAITFQLDSTTCT
jgi:hypothetical protein